MAKEKKEPKKRAEKYDAKLNIKGSFEDVIKASFLKADKVKKNK
jgi:hypothetical protein